MRNKEHSNNNYRKEPEVLVFDVFGTVVDWHGSITREVEAMALPVDGGEFANEWRKGYRPAMEGVMERMAEDERFWLNIDDLHRQILDQLLIRYDIQLSETQTAHLNKVWHRLAPWADSAKGLSRLKSQFTICTLSNGNMSLLTHLSKSGGLPWDCILSAEIFKRYKPHPEVYLSVARLFDIAPEDVMLVAAHHDDLEAARSCGFATAYIERPFEFGANAPKDVTPRPDNTLHAKDIHDLANQFGIG